MRPSVTAWLNAMRRQVRSDMGAQAPAGIAVAVVIALLWVIALATVPYLPTQAALVLLPLLLTATAAGAEVAVILALMRFRQLRDAMRDHAMHVLTDGGLLYAAIEHEPAEALRLRRSAGLAAPLAHPEASPSFQVRIRHLIQTFPSASRVALMPARSPAASRIRRTLGVGQIVVGIPGLVWLYLTLPAQLAMLGWADFFHPSVPEGATVACVFIGVTICAAAELWIGHTIALAGRTGVMLAIADVLSPERPGADSLAAWLAELRAGANDLARRRVGKTAYLAVVMPLGLAAFDLNLTHSLPPAYFIPAAAVFLSACAAAAIWLLFRARQVVRRHALRLLTDAGLLRLALVPEPPERVLRLIDSLAADVRRLSAKPWPGRVGLLRTALSAAWIGALVLLVPAAAGYRFAVPGSPLFVACAWAVPLLAMAACGGYLMGAAVGDACTSGKRLAVCDVLGGSDEAPSRE